MVVMNNKDSFEQRIKMFVGKYKSLMKIIDDKLVGINENLKSIKKRLGLKWNGIFNETNTGVSLKSS